MRCRLLPISAIAPSAVCDSEMPSLALRAAWSMPRIWVVKRCEMARPAASSLALLMRMPEDRRCRLVARSAPDAVRLRCALSDITLVLMTEDIVFLLGGWVRRRREGWAGVRRVLTGIGPRRCWDG